MTENEAGNEEPGSPERTDSVSSALATVVPQRNNTPCVYSDYGGAGTKVCFDGTGYSSPVPFFIKSVRPGNSRLWVTDTSGGAVTSYYVPDHDFVNVSSPTGTSVYIGWQGADFPLFPGAIILTATNRKGAEAYCLDMFGGPVNGTQVGIVTCNGGVYQRWSNSPNWTNPGNSIRSEAFPSKCLDFALPGVAGGKIQMWDCNGQTQQQWRFTTVDDGTQGYGPGTRIIGNITASGSYFVLDVKNGVVANWQPVWGWTYNGGHAQKWTIYDNIANHPPVVK